MRVPRRPRRRCGGGRSARGCGGGPVGTGGERMSSVTRDFAVGENPRRTRCRSRREVARAGRIRTLRMPLDQMALLSLTSTRTSEVFMVFWANFFTCWSESAEGEEREVVSGSGTGWRTRAHGTGRKPDDGGPRTGRRARRRHATLGKHRGHHVASSRRTRDPRARPGATTRVVLALEIRGEGWHAPQPPHGEPSS